MDRFSPTAEAVSTRWTRRPRNPQIAVILCIDARSPLHEDAPAYPRLLSVLQQACRARGRAGEEPPAVRATRGPAAGFSGGCSAHWRFLHPEPDACGNALSECDL